MKFWQPGVGLSIKSFNLPTPPPSEYNIVKKSNNSHQNPASRNNEVFREMWGTPEVSSFIPPSKMAALAAWNEYKCYLLILFF